MKQLAFLLLIFFTSSTLSAQTRQNEKVVIEGKEYILHTVQKKETIFSICKQYGIENKELVGANSELLFGLQEGSVIKIPVKYGQKETTSEYFIQHIVKRKETPFSIAKKYRITLDELYKYNPKARKRLKRGQVLQIPQKQIEQQEEKPVEEIIIEEPLTEETEPVFLNENRAKYFIHRIDRNETLFNLEKRFGVSEDELLALNPELNDSLHAGMKIKVPANNIPRIIAKPVHENEFVKHLVAAEETIFDIATKYKVPVPEIKKANPELNYRSVLEGEILLVPDKTLLVKIYDEEIQDSTLIEPEYLVDYTYLESKKLEQSFVAEQTEPYKVALMLPLFLESNDTINRVPMTKEELMADSVFMSTYDPSTPFPVDTFKIREQKIIDPRSENFMHFYEGVLLAVDSLKKAGMNMELHVFDTNRDKQVVDSLVLYNDFSKFDLILGPIYPQFQEAVSEVSARNGIPMVSPLAQSGKFEHFNPFYFKVNPEKEYEIRETANYIADNFYDKNFVVFKNGEFAHLPEAEFLELCKDKLFSTGYYEQVGKPLFYEYDFTTEGYWGLQRILSSERENVFIIPAYAEGQVSTAVTNINSLANDFEITLVGLSRFQNYNSIVTEYYHQTKLKYLTYYFLDYNDLGVNQFIGGFRKNFSTDPNEFSFHGFDVAYYFLNALNKFGKEFPAYISGYKLDLNQLDLDFQRVTPTGGFMNYGLFQVGYTPDFEIINYGKVGAKNLLK